MLFMVLLGCTVAVSIQIVGALLVLALLCTPAAAATQVTASPFWVPVASIVFALVAMVGGTLLALGTTVPVSPFVTTISFVIYLGCRIVRGQRDHTVQRRQPARA
jgi:zinc/manganese transport system permease protein